MGVVYEAFDRRLETTVALKTLARARPSDIARFKREFRALADVSHPNLVSLYELVAEGDEVFFTMELVPGVHFDQWVRSNAPEEPSASTQLATRREGPDQDRTQATRVDRKAASLAFACDVSRLRAALRQLAEGVHALHGHGMLHRDFKPSNVKVTPEGRVVILDFGLVTELAEERNATEERPIEGTIAFMSPEQGARQPLTAASDWYGIGVMLYVCLTGRTPFLGGRDDVLMDKQRFEPPPPAELVPAVPADLSALCAEMLRRDPERRPSGREILRRLGSQVALAGGATGSVRSSPSSTNRAIGREAEIERLERALRATRSGAAPVLVLLDGTSGMGKTHVARSFLHDAAAAGALVLRGRCYESESVPFKAVDGLIDALAAHLARLTPLEVEGLMPRDAAALARVFPVLRQVEAFTSHRRRIVSPDPQELRRRAFQGLAELLARLADRTPLVLAIDDLQWGDVDSASLLASLLRAADPPALLLLTSYRSEDREGSPCLASFREQTRELDILVEELHIGPLSVPHAEELASLHLRGIADAATLAAAVARESQGVPFFVEELARHLCEEPAELDKLSLVEALRRRLLRLPDDAARLLAIIALAARPIPRTFAERAAQVNDPGDLALLQAGGLVRSRSIAGERYVEPYHDRVRETATSLLPESDRRELHLRLARAFEATPRPDTEALAMHYGAAGALDRAAVFAEAAARRATEMLAFDRAARLFQLALDWGQAEPTLELLRELGDALANAGRGAQSAEVYLRAAQGAPLADALDLQVRASGQFLASGHIDRGLAELTGVLEAVDMALARTPTRALLSAGWSRLRLALRGLRFEAKDEQEIPASQLRRVDVTFAVAEGLGMADVVRAADFQGRHLLMALRTGEPRRIGRALAGEAVFRSFRGVGYRARTQEVMDLFESLHLEDPEMRGMLAGAAGMVAFNEGRWHDAQVRLREAETIFRDECTGHRWELATCQLFANCAIAITGRVSEMVREYPRALRQARERGDLYAETSIRATLGFYLPLVRDEPESAIAEVEDAIAHWSPAGFHLQHSNALHSLARIDLYRGNPGKALERFERSWPALKRSLLLRGQLVRTLMVGLRAHAALATALADGPRPELLALARRGIRTLERERVPYCDGNALLLRAQLAHLHADLDLAVELLERAEEVNAASDLWLNVHGARRVRALLVGGSLGEELLAQVDAFCQEAGIANPAALSRVFSIDLDSAPGA
jgi:tetratricopeptide (TPR) repeat protein